MVNIISPQLIKVESRSIMFSNKFDLKQKDDKSHPPEHKIDGNDSWLHLNNELITVHKKDKDVACGGKAPSQITAISFYQKTMMIHVNFHNISGDLSRYSHQMFKIDDIEDQRIALEMMSGKISAKDALNQVTGIRNIFGKADNAKYFCDVNPGNLDGKKIPKRVIDAKMQAAIEQHLALSLESTGRKRRVLAPFVSPFDSVRSIIREGEFKLDTHTSIADSQNDSIQSIIRAIGDISWSGCKYFEREEYSTDSVVYKSKKHKSDAMDTSADGEFASEQKALTEIASRALQAMLMQKVSELQLEMSQGWMKRGDIFIKVLPKGTSNVFVRNCFWPFSKLAQTAFCLHLS